MTKGIQTYFNISGAGVGDTLRHHNEQGGSIPGSVPCGRRATRPARLARIVASKILLLRFQRLEADVTVSGGKASVTTMPSVMHGWLLIVH